MTKDKHRLILGASFVKCPTKSWNWLFRETSLFHILGGICEMPFQNQYK